MHGPDRRPGGRVERNFPVEPVGKVAEASAERIDAGLPRGKGVTELRDVLEVLSGATSVSQSESSAAGCSLPDAVQKA